MTLPRYSWPAGKTCAVVFSADVDGESPFVWLNRGQKVETLGEVEQRRFGPRVGVHRLMDLLASFEAKGTFFVPGLTAELFPALLPTIVERGHELGLHGYHHELVHQISDDENARSLDRAIAIFERQIGAQTGAQAGAMPLGYRSPSWELTPAVHRLLRARGLTYDSSLMSFDHPYSVDGLTEIPVQWLIDDALYFRYTGGPRDKTHPANPNAVLESWLEELEGIREFGGLFMITVHPWISGRPQRIRMLRRLFEHIRRCDDVWWTTAGEIARHHATLADRMVWDVPARPAATDF